MAEKNMGDNSPNAQEAEARGRKKSWLGKVVSDKDG